MLRSLLIVACLSLNVSPSHAEHSPAALAWYARMKSHIQKYNIFPAGAKARGERGDVIVSFLVDKYGNLVSSRIHKPTCFEDLNNEALKIIRRAAPFPRPPVELLRTPGVTSLTVPVRFRYREDGPPLDPGVTSRSECLMS